MKKKILIIIIFIFLLLPFFFKKDNYQEVISDKLINSQEKEDKQIEKYLKSNKYTIDNPKVIVNPYKISPLSALIIFKTKENKSYNLYINNQKVTKTEKTKDHIIPIYGLVSGKNNKISLNKKNIYIKTKNTKYKLDVEKTNNSKETYFIASSMDLGYAGFNNKGQMIWKINSKALDLKFLKNGHILISNSNLTGDSNSSGLYEIDYLGKIYKKYELKHQFHHDVIELDNGNLMLIGIDKSSPITDGYIYIIDRNTGKELKSFNIYDIYKKIDKNFADKLKGSYSFVNSIYYKNNELILSIRGYDTIMSLDKNLNINYLITSYNYPKTFDKYILKGDNPPKGQHTAFISKEGYLGVFDNNYSLSNNKANLNDYKDVTSKAIYYKIDKENMTYKTVFEYENPDHKFNYAMGSFMPYKDHKLIDFGWNYTDNAYNKNLGIYDYKGNTYSRLIELDQNNNVIFNAKLNENSYRLYKHQMYKKKTKNYKIERSKIIDTTPYTKLKKEKNKYFKANPKLYNIDITRKTIKIDNEFDKSQKVKVIFKGKNTYIYNYQNKKIVNLNLKGKYKIYIYVDGKYYKTDLRLNFK